MPKMQKSITFVNKKYQQRSMPDQRQARGRMRTRSKTPRRARSRSRSRSRTPIRKVKYGLIDGFFQRIFSKFSLVLIDPYTYIGLLLMSALMYIHYFHVDESAVNSFVKTLKKSDSTKPFAEWIEKNINKIFAIVMMLYHSIQISSKYRYFTTLISLILILLLPTLSIATYSLIIFGLVFYHKLKKRADKFIILLCYFVTASWFYYDDIIKFHSKSTRVKREAFDNTTVV